MTAAKGTKEFYATANNSARTENFENEYIRLLMNADTTRRQIRKDRYCLTFENQYFKIDIYPFWKDKAIAEIELSDENAEIKFPKQIKVIKEVTDDEAFKNAALARI